MIKILNRNISIPKLGKLHIEKYEISGFNIDLFISSIKIGSIDAISVRTIVNESLMNTIDFTREFLNDSDKSDLVLLNGIFNNKTSLEILKQIND